jgi:hypothetical protein
MAVNDKAKKIEKKIVSLILADCSNRRKKSWNQYSRMHYRVRKFKKKNPDQFNACLNMIVAELDKIEQGANSI